ncbi:MAG: transcriptional regulator [Sphingobacteriales bacterium UTBCD1]|jgi:CRP-like cAMP-binding protein/ActR/RegA family two-component response regulator|nr:MAG: transcriptional regulator [Sphingobacteriales bacterium UTBCD1]
MKKILLIEDNNDIRENTAEILELANYKVFTAVNGKEGVEVALKEKPDLIVCDIMMPVLDGFGVLHLLNKNPETLHIPFIFLSAKTERADVRKGMALGADDYITKPFEGTELLEAVEGRLKKAGMIEEKIAGGIEGINQLLNLSGGKDAMQSLREGRNINKYRKKQVIYSEGNRPSRLFYVHKGKVRTYKSNENAKELVVGLYNEGDFLGYTALLEGTPYKETAEALEDCELAIIPKEDFESLLNNNREIASLFIKLLAKNISEKAEQLLGLAYNSLRKKVADAIIKLNKKYNTRQDPEFAIHISRENLATIAGTATESLIRTLSDFKNEQLIDIKSGSIIILNEKKLLNMLN